MVKEDPIQLSLGVSLQDNASFDNFYTSIDGNNQVVATMAALPYSDEQLSLLLWGGNGAGLTHLLQALVNETIVAGKTAQYLPLVDILHLNPAHIFESLQYVDIVCLDGLDAIFGNATWEQAVFHLFNNIKDAGNKMVFSSHTSPTELPIALPDLKSRILGSLIFHVKTMSDEEKQNALCLRAQERGMELSAEVAKFILSRASRNTSELFELLDRLDSVSLQEQRKLTIPFVKEVLEI